jgi:hypothetical protein
VGLQDTSTQVAASVAAQIPSSTLLGFAGLTLPPSQALVVQGFATAQTFAQNAFTGAQTFLTALQAGANAAIAIPPLDPHTGDVASAAAAIDRFTFPVPGPTKTLTLFSDTDTDQNPQNIFVQHLQTQLDAWVQGTATGLPPFIEQAIWDRGRAREAVASGAKRKDVLRQFSLRGFSKPPGSMAIALSEAAQEAQNNDVTSSREVMIKQADLEQSNRRFAFETAWKVQEGINNYIRERMNRLFEAYKAWQADLVMDAGHQAQIFGAEATVYGALTSAQAAVFRGQVDVNIAEANIRIESAKANLQALIQKATILVEAVKGAAQVSGQLAAAALSAVNLSAGTHDTTGQSLSINDNRQRSVLESLTSSTNINEPRAEVTG